MNALVLFKNDIRQLSAELRRGSGTSLSLYWLGNSRIWIYFSRVNGHRTDRWSLKPFRVGDKISFKTAQVKDIDEPDESLTHEELDELHKSKPKLKPGKRTKTDVSNIGDLLCHINNKLVRSVHLNTDNMLLVHFVWVGTKSGYSMIHMGLDGSTRLKIPKIKFGDEMTLSIVQAPGSP